MVLEMGNYASAREYKEVGCHPHPRIRRTLLTSLFTPISYSLRNLQAVRTHFFGDVKCWTEFMSFMQAREHRPGKKYENSSLEILSRGVLRFCALWDECFEDVTIPKAWTAIVQRSAAVDKRNARFDTKMRNESLSVMAAEGKYLDEANWNGCVDLYIGRLKDWASMLKFKVPRSSDGRFEYQLAECLSPFSTLNEGKRQCFFGDVVMFYYLTVFYYGGRAESISTATLMQLYGMEDGKEAWVQSGKIYMDASWEKVMPASDYLFCSCHTNDYHNQHRYTVGKGYESRCGKSGGNTFST